MKFSKLQRSAFVLATTTGLLVSTGCATKNYVRKETAPIINKTNELDELTARNTRDIRDVDSRAQQGIAGVNAKAEEAGQKARVAGQTAEQAQVLASTASTRAEGLYRQVVNLDNYRPVAEASVHFGFDKATLTRRAKAALDQLAAEVPNTKGFIVEITGGTDPVGDKNYNYQLSERRAAAVVQYLASEHNIPAHKIYVIGLGEDKLTDGSHAKNRRVDVRLMTNVVDAAQPAQGGMAYNR